MVGAGPAGTSAALGPARRGAEVALLERGEYPGAKNMFGGMMAYCPAPEELVPGFWERRSLGAGGDQAGAHRMGEESATSLIFQADVRLRPALGRRRLDLRPPLTGFTLFRPRSTAGTRSRPSAKG